MIGGKKICGILTEMSAEMLNIHYLVIGTGINVNMTEFPEELQKTATSLKLETGREIRRADVVCSCMKWFEKDYGIFLKYKDLTGLKETYEVFLVNKDEKVCVLEPGHEYWALMKKVNCWWRLKKASKRCMPGRSLCAAFMDTYKAGNDKE